MRIKTRVEKLESKTPRMKKWNPTDQVVFGPDYTWETFVAEVRGERQNLNADLATKDGGSGQE
jgi:hypothetical protein